MILAKVYNKKILVHFKYFNLIPKHIRYGKSLELVALFVSFLSYVKIIQYAEYSIY